MLALLGINICLFDGDDHNNNNNNDNDGDDKNLISRCWLGVYRAIVRPPVTSVLRHKPPILIFITIVATMVMIMLGCDGDNNGDGGDGDDDVGGNYDKVGVRALVSSKSMRGVGGAWSHWSSNHSEMGAEANFEDKIRLVDCLMDLGRFWRFLHVD